MMKKQEVKKTQWPVPLIYSSAANLNPYRIQILTLPLVVYLYEILCNMLKKGYLQVCIVFFINIFPV